MDKGGTQIKGPTDKETNDNSQSLTPERYKKTMCQEKEEKEIGRKTTAWIFQATKPTRLHSK